MIMLFRIDIECDGNLRINAFPSTAREISAGQEGKAVDARLCDWCEVATAAVFIGGTMAKSGENAILLPAQAHCDGGARLAQNSIEDMCCD